ncbi:MAG: TrmH family RNA methyltransferase [Planctomycetota bacterium]
MKRVKKLRKSRDRRKLGALVAEGRREVERAWAAGLSCELLMTCEAMLVHGEAWRPAGDADRWLEVPAELFGACAYHDKPEGVLAVFAEPGRTLDGLRVDPADASPLVLVVVGAEKPGNLGAMVRSAEAAGAAAVLSVDAVVDPFNPNAIRNSTGAVFSTPVIACGLDEARAWLSSHGLAVLATVAADDARGEAAALWELELSGPLAVVVGAEAGGLPDAWVESADLRATIPTAGASVDSLNASVAAAVVLFEARRQRGG